MATEIDTKIHTPVTSTVAQRRIKWLVSGMAVRLLIAFVISWLIVMAFFVSGVISH